MPDQLEELARLMPVPDGSGDVVDWSRIEAGHGLVFPSDYRRFIGLYGGGVIDDYLSIAVPLPGEDYIDLLHRNNRVASALRTLREGDPDDCRFPIWPEPGGLVCWAGGQAVDYTCWLTSGHPDSWPVVLWDRQAWQWRRFEGGMVALLVAAIKREITPFFTEDWFPSATPRFVYWREDRLRWAGQAPAGPNM